MSHSYRPSLSKSLKLWFNFFLFPCLSLSSCLTITLSLSPYKFMYVQFLPYLGDFSAFLHKTKRGWELPLCVRVCACQWCHHDILHPGTRPQAQVYDARSHIGMHTLCYASYLAVCYNPDWWQLIFLPFHLHLNYVNFSNPTCATSLTFWLLFAGIYCHDLDEMSCYILLCYSIWFSVKHWKSNSVQELLLQFCKGIAVIEFLNSIHFLMQYSLEYLSSILRQEHMTIAASKYF